MKQTVVLGVSFCYKRPWPYCLFYDEITCPTKALKIVAGFSGVESVAWKADDKSKLEVTGEDIDPVCLTRKLRKKIGPIKILSVEEKKEEKKDEKKDEKKVEWVVCTGPQLLYPVGDDYSSPSCTIL